MAEDDTDRYPPIADYALLSDCHSAALVSRAGSVDWACLRRFDAPSVFGRLLDWERGGHFALGLVDGRAVGRRYESGSLVLCTDMAGPEGTATVTDAFAMRAGGRTEPRQALLREVEVTDGTVELDVIVEPRFDYGVLRPWLRAHGAGGGPPFSAVGGEDALVLRADVPLTLDRDAVRIVGRVRLRAGERARFVLTARSAHELAVEHLDSGSGTRNPGEDGAGNGDADEGDGEDADAMEQTRRWWRTWSEGTNVPGRPDVDGAEDPPWADAVRQSAVVLKGLTCAPTGAIVAAPTTSLPEWIGGTRNFDYRYSWIRDSTLALDALAAVGHEEVAAGFLDFLMRSAAGHAEDLQIMYGPYGGRRLTEAELDLDGYRGSRPVRIGNAAAGQVQLDVYGHIVDAAHHWNSRHESMDDDLWGFLRQVVDTAAARWQEPDRGVWEMRGDPQHFVYSKVMVWVALDRGAALADERGDPVADGWRRSAREVRETVMERGVTDGHFTQTFDRDRVDASLLKLAGLGFIDPGDPLMRGTLDAVVERLGTPEGFLRRYERDGSDGFTGREGVFLLCQSWLVAALLGQDRVAEAEEAFSRLLGAGNDVGLFAEEHDPDSGQLLGNFPQAFTHLGIINAACRLAAHGRRGGQGQ